MTTTSPGRIPLIAEMSGAAFAGGADGSGAAVCAHRVVEANAKQAAAKVVVRRGRVVLLFVAMGWNLGLRRFSRRVIGWKNDIVVTGNCVESYAGKRDWQTKRQPGEIDAFACKGGTKPLSLAAYGKSHQARHGCRHR
jgi:hypothetical protein